jgi:hypothetical protein
MENEQFREGETIEFTATDKDDGSADTFTLTISQDGVILKTAQDNFTPVDGVPTATAKVTDNDLPIGVYDYMFTTTWTDGFIAKSPDVDECDDECELPTLTICDANDVETS